MAGFLFDFFLFHYFYLVINYVLLFELQEAFVMSCSVNPPSLNILQTLYVITVGQTKRFCYPARHIRYIQQCSWEEKLLLH